MMMYKTRKRRITFRKIVRALVISVAMLVLGLVMGYVIHTQPAWIIVLIFAAIFLAIVFFLKGKDF